MSQLNFDASQVAPDTGGGDPVPAGWYNVMIDESEMKPTKAEGGMRLSLRFTIMDGQYVNRKVFTGLNLKNANPVAQEIAYKQLSAICHAVGVMQVQDSQQLHGRPLKIKVKVKAASGDYDASNDVSAYKNINEQVDGGAVSAGAPWAQQPHAPAQAPAWAPQAPAAPVAQAPQFAPPTAPAAPPTAPAAPAQPAWQPPAVQQPWAPPAQAPQQFAPPAQQFAPPVQQAPAQQFAPQAPAQAPAGATPPWMQQASAPAAGAPPWAQPQQ